MEREQLIVDRHKVIAFIKANLADKYVPWEDAGPGLDYQDRDGDWHFLKVTLNGNELTVQGLPDTIPLTDLFPAVIQ